MKTYIVTGATGGIGSAIVQLLCGDGHHVVLTDIAEPAEDFLSELASLAGTHEFVACDITDPKSVETMVKAAKARHGRLDGAVNCAGIEHSLKPLAEVDVDDWNRVIAVDLTAMFLCLKFQIEAMLPSGGSIVNIGSGLANNAVANASEYVAAKAGVSGLTKAAALDYQRSGIRVNALLPGAISTPMLERHADEPFMPAFMEYIQNRQGRLGLASEVAEAAKWLLSDAASFVTGIQMPVDGGLSAG